MLGRLFGVMLATVLERSLDRAEQVSDLVEAFQSSMSEFFNSMNQSGHHDHEGPFGRTCDEVDGTDESPASAEAKIPDSRRCETGPKPRISQPGASEMRAGDGPVQPISGTRLFSENVGRMDCQWYQVCPFHERADLEGLISFLTQMCQGNPHDKQIICVTGTTTRTDPVFQARSLVDLRSDSYFHSYLGPNQWICYDFRDMRVTVTHYVLRSVGPPYQIDTYQLRSWVVEGSDDEAKWIELDRHDGDSSLGALTPNSSFEVQTIAEFRFVRLRQTGPNSSGNDYLIFRAWELFGGLRRPRK
jgi:hypothetical protein